MSSLVTRFSALWFNPCSSDEAPPQELLLSDAGETTESHGGCFRGLMWAVVIEGVGVAVVTFVAHALHTLHF